jgi:hypothetical protein
LSVNDFLDSRIDLGFGCDIEPAKFSLATSAVKLFECRLSSLLIAAVIDHYVCSRFTESHSDRPANAATSACH